MCKWAISNLVLNISISSGGWTYENIVLAMAHFFTSSSKQYKENTENKENI
jgi:hypothetical protein